MSYEIKHLSASQVKTFQMCQRKWFFEYPLGIKSPPTKAQTFGVDVHTQLEEYWLKGITPYSPAARAALKLIPTHEVHPFVELPLDAPPLMLTGIKVKGFIDLLLDEGKWIHIYDYKTTADMKWALTEKQISQDVQMNAYARWAYLKNPTARVTVSLVYMLKDGSNRAEKRCAEIGFADSLDFWSGLVPTGEAMKFAAQVASVSDLPANYDACGNYGGCPHQKICPRSPAAMFKGITKESENVSRLLDLMKAKIETKAEGKPLHTGVIPPDAPPNAKPEARQLGLEGEVKPGPGSVTAATGLRDEFLFLYVNAMPRKVENLKRLDEVLWKLSDDICKAKEVSDIRLLSFGEGAARFSAAVRDMGSTLTGAYYVDGKTYLGNIAVEALAPLASEVVTGV